MSDQASAGSPGEGLAAGGVPEIAVVIPVYNGRPVLEELIRRLRASLREITENYAIVLVDDVAPDNPWPAIRELAKHDPRIKGVRLSRNFGQHYALTAGIDLIKARWYVIMDCDLQDAPEDIAALYRKAMEGHDLVVGERRKIGHATTKRFFSRVFYAVFRTLSGIRIDPSVGNFRIFSDAVAEGFRNMREQMRFVPASFEWMGFDPVYVELPHHHRAEGRSSYTVWKLFRLAAHTILAHSQMPLKIVAGLGLLMSFVTFCMAGLYFGRALLFGSPVEGWPSLFVTMMFFGSVQIAMMGILGIYIGKTFEEAKRRPLYIVKDMVNFTSTK